MHPILTVALLVVLGLPALADPPVLEDPNEPYLPPSVPFGPPPADGAMERGLDFGVQVNTAANGANIVGDAGNEPSICVDPAHPWRMAVGWRQFDTIASNFREAGVAWSRDAGRTWHPGVLTNGVFRSDPVLRSDRNGVFYYYSLRTTTACDMFKSIDGGRTWSAPVAAFGGDKAWLCIDNTGGIGDSNLYIHWSTFAGCCGSNVITRSVNDGASYSAPISFPTTASRCVFGTSDVGPGGEYYIIGCAADTFPSGFWVHRSNNAQNPAANPFTIAQSTQPPLGGNMAFTSPHINPQGLLGQAQIVVDRSGGPRNGWVYALCSVYHNDPNDPGVDPMDVRLCRSTDGGATWSAPITLGDDAPGVNAYQWFGTISIAPNGRLDVVYNDSSVDPTPRTPTFSRTYYTTSSDGGATWAAPVAIGPAWNHRAGYPQQSKIGDYYDMHSDNVGCNLIYAATFNGEQDVYFKRIGDYDCNGNGVGDATDVSGGASRDDNRDGIPDECQCVGDLDGDLDVDLTDLARLLAHFGQASGATLADGDIDGDGDVDLTDLAILLARFGATCV